MIYIIIDTSYECDGYCDSKNKIIYVSSNREKAMEFFDKYYGSPPESDKWEYSYRLLEYPEGYSLLGEQEPNILKVSNNSDYE